MAHERLIQKNRDDAYQFRIERRIRIDHTHGDEISKLRKEIAHIEAVLGVEPTEEFREYYEGCENAKQEASREIGDE